MYLPLNSIGIILACLLVLFGLFGDQQVEARWLQKGQRDVDRQNMQLKHISLRKKRETLTEIRAYDNQYNDDEKEKSASSESNEVDQPATDEEKADQSGTDEERDRQSDDTIIIPSQSKSNDDTDKTANDDHSTDDDSKPDTSNDNDEQRLFDALFGNQNPNNEDNINEAYKK